MNRDDGMERMMHVLIGEHKVEDANIKSYDVYKITTKITVGTRKNKIGRLDYSDMLKNIVEHTNRNYLIVTLANMLFQQGRKVLLLTSRKTHVNLIQEMCTKYGMKTATMYGNKKTYNDAPILIGTFPKIGTGFDEKSFCPDYGGQRLDSLILCTSIKSKPSLIQFVGRILRADSPIIYDLVDGNGTFTSHWSERLKVYTQSQATIHYQKVEWRYDQGNMIGVNLVETRKSRKLGKNNSSTNLSSSTVPSSSSSSADSTSSSSSSAVSSQPSPNAIPNNLDNLNNHPNSHQWNTYSKQTVAAFF